jgi:hypothetical protein
MKNRKQKLLFSLSFSPVGNCRKGNVSFCYIVFWKQQFLKANSSRKFTFSNGSTKNMVCGEKSKNIFKTFRKNAPPELIFPVSTTNILHFLKIF